MLCCFFKQKTSYEMRISDWSSDVCSSDLPAAGEGDDADEHDCQRGPVRGRADADGLQRSGPDSGPAANADRRWMGIAHRQGASGTGRRSGDRLAGAIRDSFAPGIERSAGKTRPRCPRPSTRIESSGPRASGNTRTFLGNTETLNTTN